MGSFIEINDTLQLTTEQGFPSDLVYEKHKLQPYTTTDFQNKIFEFKDKKNIRVYKIPSVRNFLVQNIDGKWLYWGLIHIVELTHDNLAKTTSGKFKIVYIYSPEEMKHVYNLVDRNEGVDFFEVF